LFKFVKYCLETIEASLLYIQAKTFADNHRCVFHFSKFNSSDFLVKTSEKKWTIYTKGMGFLVIRQTLLLIRNLCLIIWFSSQFLL